MRTISSVFCLALVAVSTSGAAAAGIRGDYVEARTADVFTGPCFSNAEIFITGKEAMMAWKVTSGSWKGVDLRVSVSPRQSMDRRPSPKISLKKPRPCSSSTPRRIPRSALP